MPGLCSPLSHTSLNAHKVPYTRPKPLVAPLRSVPCFHPPRESPLTADLSLSLTLTSSCFCPSQILWTHLRSIDCCFLRAPRRQALRGRGRAQSHQAKGNPHSIRADPESQCAPHAERRRPRYLVAAALSRAGTTRTGRAACGKRASRDAWERRLYASSLPRSPHGHVRRVPPVFPARPDMP